MSTIGSIGFLGYGNMATAIVEGLINNAVITPDRVIVYDPDDSRVAEARELGLRIADAPAGLAAAQTIVLAVKPQRMAEAVEPLANTIGDTSRVLSIAAGVGIAKLRALLPKAGPIIRVMPNTPALVGAGAAAIALEDGATDEDANIARTMFEAVGMAEVVNERDMDAVTALSGSGPAYCFLLVESLVKAAVAQGLDEQVATRLAVQTVYGAGLLMSTSDVGPGVLRARVTSKGGTTQAALERFAAADFETIVADAVAAAADRSRELGA